MNLDVLKYTICEDYEGLLEFSKESNDSLAKFYYHYANYKLNNDLELFDYLNNNEFSCEKVCIIYDLLAKDNKKEIIEAKKVFYEKYKAYIHLDKTYTDEEIDALANKITLPERPVTKINFKLYIGFGLLILGLIALLIVFLTFNKLDSEVLQFTTILLFIIPSILITLGINFSVFKKQNALLMALEAYLFVYIFSFLALYNYYDGVNLIIRLKNHFFGTIKALYEFAQYHTFKDWRDYHE